MPRPQWSPQRRRLAWATPMPTLVICNVATAKVEEHLLQRLWDTQSAGFDLETVGFVIEEVLRNVKA